MNSKALIALLGFILALGVNFAAVQLPLNGMSPPELSDLYPNLFVPANVTFSIWSVIYLGLLVFIIDFLRQSGKPSASLFEATHPWFIVSCILNAGWIVCWHFLQPELALIIMVALLVTLLKLYLSVRAVQGNSVHRWIVAIPFSIYTSWICVALIANSAAVLVHQEFSGLGFSPVQWTVTMMVIASLISMLFLVRFRDIAFGLVTIWALLGIYMKRDPFRFPEEQTIVTAALVLMIALGLLAAFTFLMLGKKKAPTA